MPGVEEVVEAIEAPSGFKLMGWQGNQGDFEFLVASDCSGAPMVEILDKVAKENGYAGWKDALAKGATCKTLDANIAVYTAEGEVATEAQGHSPDAYAAAAEFMKLSKKAKETQDPDDIEAAEVAREQLRALKPTATESKTGPALKGRGKTKFTAEVLDKDGARKTLKVQAKDLAEVKGLVTKAGYTMRSAIMNEYTIRDPEDAMTPEQEQALYDALLDVHNVLHGWDEVASMNWADSLEMTGPDSNAASVADAFISSIPGQ